MIALSWYLELPKSRTLAIFWDWSAGFRDHLQFSHPDTTN